MRCTIPEISWHNRDPVLSIDIQTQSANEEFYRLASGGTDSHVLIWHVKPCEDGGTSVEFASDLVRHQKAVNAVRFSPSGEFLATGDDESVIIIWKQRQETDAPELTGPGESEVVHKESWVVQKVLRGHLEDVYDISWSPDSSCIISGSVDNTAILWDINKGKLGMLDDHKGFVQGVAWDPKGSYVATLSSDRKLRVFNSSTKKLLCRVGKAPLPVPKGHELEGKNIHLFHDDTIQTFFRRLTFSPDGEMIIAPSGVIEAQEPGKKPKSSTLVFSRRLLNRPVCYLPSLDEYSVCVRCCPVLFELRNLDPSTKPESMFLLPYRVVFAVATASAVVLYDTQQPMPFGYISNLHYARLTDLAWSPKGDMLMVSSTDGYCSIITFSPEELGVVYKPKEAVPQSASTPVPPTSTSDGKDSVETSANDKVEKMETSSSGTKEESLVSEVDSVVLSDKAKNASQSEAQPESGSSDEPKPCSTPEPNQLVEKESKQIITKTPDAKKVGEKVNENIVTKTPDLNKENTSDNAAQKEKASQSAVASSDLSQLSIADNKTPSDSGKKARRVQLITLSSPKSRKKLL